jgi:hypothetical protein
VSELFWSAIWLPVLTGLVLSLVIERQLKPGVSPIRQRPPAALALHCGLWLLIFACELMQFRRPWFAVAATLALQIVLVLVNNAKVRTLREPFVVQDFEYFIDTLRHPRLYLPFFGLRTCLLAALGFLLALVTGLHLESPLTAALSTAAFLIDLVILMLTGLLLLATGAWPSLPVSFSPDQDLWRYGFLPCLWRYAREERHRPTVSTPFSTIRPRPEPHSPLPHLIVVQSESFFDPRSWVSNIRPEILHHFDSLKTEAIYHGKATVPAWGANTVRTEFAFLSGLAEEQLGGHRFNPYRHLANSLNRSLVNLLNSLGYRTICVHPYPASFYGRDRLFPGMGFDLFIDIKAFSSTQKSGPYIGDAAVADTVCGLFTTSDQPLFVFVITMENHGPLHWEKVHPEDVQQLYTSPPAAGCDDLTVYLRHLANADRMAGTLAKHLAMLPRPGWLCWFGDHVPIMPKVYTTLGLPDGRTDYLIWSNTGGKHSACRRDLPINQVGMLLMETMGLADRTVTNTSPCVDWLQH